MNVKMSLKFCVLLFFIFIITTMVHSTNTQGIYKDIPIEIQPKAKYLFYLHGHIIEIKGIRPISEKYGAYEYEKILDTLKNKGFIVISEPRKKGTNVSLYARKIASQIKTLLKAGVPPANIIVVGASKGAFIAMFVSTILQNREIAYVLLSGCQEGILRFDIDLYGNILSIYDEKDQLVGSCHELFEVSTGINRFKEIKLTVGTGHGIVYKPLEEWINPIVLWANGKNP